MVTEIEDRILEKSRELFFRFGLRNVTMDDIAGELGISKKTLYTSFDKKKTIVEEVTKRYLDCQVRQQMELASNSHDAVHELVKIMEHLNTIFESLDIRVIHDMQRYFPESWMLFENHKSDFILKSIIDNLERGKAEGLFREDINVDIIAKIRMEQVQLAMDPSVFPGDSYNIKEIHYQLLLQYVHGISTLKGRSLINKYMNRKDD